jgi:hypothetical protein
MGESITMITRYLATLVVAIILSSLSQASPTPIPAPTARLDDRIGRVPPRPAVTLLAESDKPTRTVDKRNLDDLGNSLSSALHQLGEAIDGFATGKYIVSSGTPAHVKGVPNAFRDWPSGTNVIDGMGLHHTMLSALPTQVLNLPPYANWTSQGWNVRFHGNVCYSCEGSELMCVGIQATKSFSTLPRHESPDLPHRNGLQTPPRGTKEPSSQFNCRDIHRSTRRCPCRNGP